ncbi:MAG TPA: MucR family transcriptional regulator [Acetobacteraceae bacterium]|nr:MucR family transcriptional regulator [Acetobacteraceae bacterium]
MTEELLALTGDIVTAHVSHNAVSTAELPALIRATFEALQKLGEPTEPQEPVQQPAVSIRASVKPDYFVCLEDGKKLTMLKRYLRINFDMSPDDYRAKWGLPKDYPMVAPNYAEKRRTLAHSIGLGQRKAAKSAEGVVTSAVEPVEPVAEPIVEAVKTSRKKLGIAAAKATAGARPDGGIPAPRSRKLSKPKALKAS